jgi:TetR/AcrR family transcriptional repressor of nem operon
MNSSRIVGSNKEKVFTSNHYFLIFDALKMLPDFKKERTRQQKDELTAWARIIRVAKKSGEISSDMTDVELARLFIYTAKGAGINCIMEDNYGHSRKEIKALWDGLYKSLRS